MVQNRVLSKGKMMNKAKILAGCIAFATMGVVGAAQAGFYVGVGAGAVRLDPNVGSNLTIKDDGRDTGIKAIVGKRLARRVSIEAFYTALGTAEFDPAGDVDYSSYGLNAIMALNAPAHGSKRPQYFVNMGVGALDTASDNTTTDRDNDLLVNAGVGVSFPMRHGLSLRAHLEGFERDASMFSAVLIKEFGACHSSRCAHGKHSKKHQLEVAEELPIIATAPAVDSAVDSAVEESDGEGALSLLFGKTAVAAKPVEQSVDLGKSLDQLENAYFNKDSAYITDGGEQSLQLLMQTMSDYPKMEVEIQGHADVEEAGSARALSELRVLRVSNFLVKNGIDAERLSLIAYGNSQPASAEAGSNLNRRVQFRILSVE